MPESLCGPEFDLTMEKTLLNLAGEFLVAAELNRRQILCSVTYGASKSADLFAFGKATDHLLRIEVKTTTKSKWPVGQRGMTASSNGSGCVWVLVFLPPPLDTLELDDRLRGQHAPRFFVLTAQEVESLTRAGYDKYSRRYQDRHGVPYSKPGVPVITLVQAAEHESGWDKVRNAMQGCKPG
jgi:hypothetical protein